MKRFLFDENFNIVEDGVKNCIIEKSIAEFNASEGDKEKATEYVFQDKSNDKIEVVLAKVVILNEFYSTRLNSNPPQNSKGKKRRLPVDLVNMAKHIVCCQDFDRYWSSDDVEEQVKAVAYISTGESAYKNNKNHCAAYSFATKYCSWHDSEKFPVVDGYTKGMLYYLNRELQFYEKKYQRSLNKTKLNEYSVFCKVYRALQSFLRERGKDFSTKDLDKFLWYYGKEHAIKLDI